MPTYTRRDARQCDSAHRLVAHVHERLRKAPDNIKLLVLQALKDLCREHIPARLRLHPLGGYRNPKVYTIDVAENHAYKASLSIDGETARLRRVGTHKQIDRTA